MSVSVCCDNFDKFFAVNGMENLNNIKGLTGIVSFALNNVFSPRPPEEVKTELSLFPKKVLPIAPFSPGGQDLAFSDDEGYVPEYSYPDEVVIPMSIGSEGKCKRIAVEVSEGLKLTVDCSSFSTDEGSSSPGYKDYMPEYINLKVNSDESDEGYSMAYVDIDVDSSEYDLEYSPPPRVVISQAEFDSWTG